MASIAELLVSGATQTAQKAGEGLSRGIQTGAQLAQSVEQNKIKRAELENAKLQARQKKMQNMNLDIFKAKKLGGKALSGYRDFLKNKARVLQVDDIYTPESIDLITSVPENIDRYEVLVSEVESGERPLANAQEVLKDEGLFYELDPAQRERLAAAAKTATLEKGKLRRAEVISQATTERAREGRAAAADVQIAKKLGDEFVKFKGAGGEAGLSSKIRKLDAVIRAFETGEIKTGGVLQSLPVTGGDAADRVFRKRFKESQDTVKGVINVKQILDSQFGDKALLEVQRNLGIDGALESEQNLKRLKELRRSMLEEVKDKTNEFKKRGFFKGEAKPKAGKKSTAPAKAAPETFEIRGQQIPREAILDRAKQDPGFLQALANELGTTLKQLKDDLGVN